MTKPKTLVEKIHSKMMEVNELANQLKQENPELSTIYSVEFESGDLVRLDFFLRDTRLTPLIPSSAPPVSAEPYTYPAHEAETDLPDVVDLDDSAPLTVTHPGYDPTKGAESIPRAQGDDPAIAPAANRRGLTETER